MVNSSDNHSNAIQENFVLWDAKIHFFFFFLMFHLIWNKYLKTSQSLFQNIPPLIPTFLPFCQYVCPLHNTYLITFYCCMIFLYLFASSVL